MSLPDQTPDDPFAGFTATARRVVSHAELEAASFDKHEVAPEHLLLGLTRETTGYAYQVLSAMGIDHDKIAAVLSRLDGVTPHPITGVPQLSGEVKLSLAARRTVTRARREAVRLNHAYIGTEHLLLAIVGETVGISAGMIEELGASLEKITVATEELIKVGSTAEGGTPEQIPVLAGNAAVSLPIGAVMSDVHFSDVEGCDEAKVELQETIDFLRFPDRFTKLGARIPRGVMLYGPPGTGKTLLAKAVSAEAGVPLYPVAGSDFVEMYVGQGAKRVRDLFKKVRKAGAGIIFIDEIDALARKRDSGGSSGRDREADQTLNALLVEMDGFGTSDNVIVMAATNRLDMLDPAVLRPGRFTRHIEVPLPDLKARLKILGVHARNKPLAPDVDLESLAKRTGGFSGAELANVMNEAAILAARRDGDCLTAEDLDAGWLKTMMGTSQRRSKEPKARALCAAHEIGHALCGHFGGAPMAVEEISLYSHGQALAMTIYSDNDEKLQTADEFHGDIISLMGGRAGEWVAFSETTPGVSDDLERANRVAANMVKLFSLGAEKLDDYGLGENDLIGLLVKEHIVGIPTIEAALEAQRRILATDYRTAVDLIRAHPDLFERLCAHIFAAERMGRDEFISIVEGRLNPSSDALLAWRDIVGEVRGRPSRSSGNPATMVGEQIIIPNDPFERPDPPPAL
jgi:cell division protease FtsH